MITLQYFPGCRYDRARTVILPDRSAFYDFYVKHYDKGVIYGVKEVPMSIDVTHHGKRRIRERCGIKSKGADRLARIAFEKGLTRSDVSGSLARYMDFLYHYNCEANNVRIYGDKIYIFCNEVLVTVYNLPKRYRDMANRMMKEKNHGVD
jgi:hypothetical protein